MLFSVYLQHIELISIYAFYTFKKHTEEFMYTVDKIHMTLGSGKPHFWVGVAE